jgi:hypothetical protein
MRSREGKRIYHCSEGVEHGYGPSFVFRTWSSLTKTEMIPLIPSPLLSVEAFALALKQPVPVPFVSCSDISACDNLGIRFYVELAMQCGHYHDAMDVSVNVATAQFPALIGARKYAWSEFKSSDSEE